MAFLSYALSSYERLRIGSNSVYRNESNIRNNDGEELVVSSEIEIP
jgi:hypothetical protein